MYKTFESFFVPLMHHTYTYLLSGGLLDQTWSMGVQTNIPKGSCTDSITELRPLTIVNVMLKWISTILLLQLHDVFLQLVPTQKAGLMKVRDMYQNLLHSSSFQKALFCAVGIGGGSRSPCAALFCAVPCCAAYEGGGAKRP